MSEKKLKFYSDLKEKVENKGIKIIPVIVVEDQNYKACAGDVVEIESEIKESLKYFSKEIQLQKVYQTVDNKSEYFIKKPFFIKEWCEDEQNSYYFKKHPKLLTKKIELENYPGFELNRLNDTKEKFTEIIKDYKEKPNFVSSLYGKYNFVYFNHLLKIIEKIKIYNKKINETENINGSDVILSHFCFVDVKKRIKKLLVLKNLKNMILMKNIKKFLN